MRGQAMKNLVRKLEAVGIELSKFKALEFFAREGDWQTQSYYHLVNQLEAWEIEKSFMHNLRKNLPDAIIKNVNSFREAKETSKKFDFIVIDNPQNIYGENGQYCEHFECLPLAVNILNNGGFLVFNVNIEPFNFDVSPKWKERRELFYNTKDTKILSLKFLEHFYLNYLNNFRQAFLFHGFERRSNYLYYAVFRLQLEGCT